jgi:Family of unknown function (DUF5752)
MERFRFSSVAHLESPVGRVATNLDSLREGIEFAGLDSLFHHLTRVSLRHPHAGDQPANDFARWVGTALQDRETAERLAFVGATLVSPLETLRTSLLDVIASVPARRRRQEAAEEAAFHFVRSVSVRAPLGLEASDPAELVGIWPRLDLASVFYHLIEATVHGPEEDALLRWLRESDANAMADSAERLASTGRTLSRLHRDLGTRWRRILIPSRLVDRLEAPEEVRREQARLAVARLAGRLRSKSERGSKP